MVTMKEIARLAGVSVATVSHVINNTKHMSPETTSRVLEAVAATHYHPNRNARALRRGHTGTIGVIAEDIRAMRTAEVLDGISETVEQFDQHLLFVDMHAMRKLENHYDETGAYRRLLENCVSLLTSADVDGILYVAMHHRNLTDYFKDMNVPLVVAFSHCDSNHCVEYDNYHGARDAASLLLENGHRDMAMVAGHRASPSSQARIRGFGERLAEARLTVQDVRFCDWDFDKAVDATNELMQSQHRPTAIFAANDTMAAGCIRALQTSGYRVPQDVSVVGFDNRVLAAEITPALSTIEIPCMEIGRKAAELLMKAIADPKLEPQDVVLPCTLIERDSVAKRN